MSLSSALQNETDGFAAVGLYKVLQPFWASVSLLCTRVSFWFDWVIVKIRDNVSKGSDD